MPTYDYRCDACGHEMALFQSITEPRARKCPKCSKRRLRRLIGSGAGIIFKGSGFYETDYKRNRSPSSKETPKTEKKKDSAPAKKDAPAPKKE
ncbi:MAG: FmdB family zinc ribbon protein [Planctomycetota bacterium]